jgi:hypothetical protein
MSLKKLMLRTSLLWWGALFVILALEFAAVAQTITAAEAIQRIRQRYAAAPPNQIDTIKAGDPTTPVTGIATTFLDTMDVLRQASSHGTNLVITHEPTFYNHLDDTAFFADDPVYREKLALPMMRTASPRNPNGPKWIASSAIRLSLVTRKCAASWVTITWTPCANSMKAACPAALTW